MVAPYASVDAASIFAPPQLYLRYMNEDSKMASDPECGKDGNNSSPKSENPFIKFRQFADEQVSSLLQGIIGLPSAISKDPSRKARWADFDEDLRRRDELQERQRQLREAETGQPDRRPTGSPANWDIHPGKSSAPLENEKAPTQMDERMARDIPLYSPTHKSLFAHLDQRGESTAEWHPNNTMKTLNGGFIPHFWPWCLRPEQFSTDPIRNMQSFSYNELNAQPHFRSNYSLLPYILFSPYSPLKLAADKVTGSAPTHKMDTFKYCAAFEDLILTTHGSSPENVGYYTWDFIWDSARPVGGMEWILHLRESGLLQQKETHNIRQMLEWPNRFKSPRVVWVGWPLEKHDDSPETEAEMYQRFLSAQAREPPEILESLFNEAEGFIEKQLKALDSPEGKRALREIFDSKVVKEIFEMVKESESEVNPPLPEEPREQSADSKSPRHSKSAEVKSRQSEPDPDTTKVVHTQTTSNRNVDEDGSVETTVTVWKLYADGRESTTTTQHFEDAGAWKEPEEKPQEVHSAKISEGKKKGWFWN
ncbi:hypothetical protein LSUE1_G002490 [Lachnellula suecica]|uniref:Uncharacterized protein n=1 Tax=Lachnellula suecica TaxID=602035 RepID=A0A8T9CH83_9HELO|nr:hypothetical protein LSUE1_G002490 [Lachnellula suecica]